MTGEAPQPPPPGGFAPPQGAQPPQQAAYPPPTQGPYPPTQPGYGPPPPGWYPPVPDQGPGNDVAVAGFVLSVVGVAILFFSSGLGAPLTLILAILGIIFSRKGKQKVQRGESRRHGGLAQAGFIVGIVGVALAILAALAWIAIAVLAAAADDFDDTSNPDGFEAVTTLLALGRSWSGLG